jgi:hypothetical protein
MREILDWSWVFVVAWLFVFWIRSQFATTQRADVRPHFVAVACAGMLLFPIISSDDDLLFFQSCQSLLDGEDGRFFSTKKAPDPGKPSSATDPKPSASMLMSFVPYTGAGTAVCSPMNRARFLQPLHYSFGLRAPPSGV